MDALALGLAAGAFDWVCSSHLIEHFVDPALHVAEIARVLTDGGAAFFLTPNEPADFENPFHLHLFRHGELAGLLRRYFEDVWVGGVDAVATVKADFAARRAKAAKLLALDVFDLRHRIPRRWYVTAYTRLLPLAYRLVARSDTGGTTGITADDWFVTDSIDETTLVLFAVARRPARAPRPCSLSALTGGIGSGKSAVGDLMVERGAVLIDADQIAREIVAPGGRAYQPLVDRFGPGVLAADGTIDRQALAARVFSNPEELAALNAITHPAIAVLMVDAAARRMGPTVVLLDIPLFTAVHQQVLSLDAVVVVDCPVEVAMERLVARRGFDRSDAQARVACQTGRDERRAAADFVIDNSGDLLALVPQVERVWGELASRERAKNS